MDPSTVRYCTLFTSPGLPFIRTLVSPFSHKCHPLLHLPGPLSAYLVWWWSCNHSVQQRKEVNHGRPLFPAISPIWTTNPTPSTPQPQLGVGDTVMLWLCPGVYQRHPSKTIQTPVPGPCFYLWRMNVSHRYAPPFLFFFFFFFFSSHVLSELSSRNPCPSRRLVYKETRSRLTISPVACLSFLFRLVLLLSSLRGSKVPSLYPCCLGSVGLFTCSIFF